VLEISGLSFAARGRELFFGLDMIVNAGESLAVVGPSGSGKTSLLNIIIGTVQPDAGHVNVCGESVVRASRRALTRIRSERLGIVFQHGELIGDLSPVENVVVPSLLAGTSFANAQRRAQMLLAHFGVPENAATADELSGGERQRTALARALMNTPALILADEPTGSLDVETRDQVADVLFGAPLRWGCGLVVVTHDPVIAARADHVIEMKAQSNEGKEDQ
jgi:ABC-type lipoprotein export system ATPase subunit